MSVRATHSILPLAAVELRAHANASAKFVFNCLAGASDSLFFCRSLLSADLHDGRSAGRDTFRTRQGHVAKCGSFSQRVMVSCSAHRGRGSIALSVRAIHSFFAARCCRPISTMDGPQGETHFARGRGTSPNRGSFTQRVTVSCSAHRGRGGAFNCLVGTSDSLVFLALSASAVWRRYFEATNSYFESL